MKNASEVPQKNSPLAEETKILLAYGSVGQGATTGLCKPKYNRQLQKDGYAWGKLYV